MQVFRLKVESLKFKDELDNFFCSFFGGFVKKHYLCSRFCERAKFLAKWCNGSTTDSGSVCLGSSPSLATKKEETPIGVSSFLYVYPIAKRLITYKQGVLYAFCSVHYPIAPLTEITCPDT